MAAERFAVGGRWFGVVRAMGTWPWIVSDGLWERIEPLLPEWERRFRTRVASRSRTGQMLCGILFVLHTGVQWEHLPQELGFGSGMACWRRPRDWNEAGVCSSCMRYCWPS
jgi:transposase